MMTIPVNFFFRKPFDGYHSIELVFADIIHVLPEDISACFVEMPHVSKGFFRRLVNIIYCNYHRGKVNHITGDIHYVTLGLRGKQTILTIHDIEILRRSRFFKRIVIGYFWFMLPVNKVSVVTVVSEFTKRELLKYVKVNPQKIQVIPDCISDIWKYHPKEFNVRPRILHVGTKQNKNLDNLVKAIAGIPSHLVILGRLNYSQVEVLRKYKISYENHFDLSDQDVINLYCGADMLAFVSTYEGFGLPILEAQSVGRPVITSNVASMPEVAGEGAVFVDPFDIHSIRKGILDVIHNKELREYLIVKGRMNAMRFQSHVIAEKYARLYRITGK